MLDHPIALGVLFAFASALVLITVALLARNRLRAALIRALERHGPEAALALLDEKVPPQKLLGSGDVSPQRERMAGLALINHYTQLEREIAAHAGTAAVLAQIHALGLLALAVRADDPRRAAARLEELAGETERAGLLAGPVRGCTRSLARLADALVTGARLEPDIRAALERLCDQGGLAQLVIWQALRQALVAACLEDQAEVFARKVRALTAAFEPPTAVTARSAAANRP